MVITKVRRNPKFLDELFAEKDLMELKVNCIGKVVDDLNAQGVFIDSCKSVLNEVRASSSNKPRNLDGTPSLRIDSIERNLFVEDVTERDVRKVLKEKGMRFKKVVHIAMSANSQRSLVLRQ